MEIAGAITLISQELGLDQIKILGDMEFVGRYGFGGGGVGGGGGAQGTGTQLEVELFETTEGRKGGTTFPLSRSIAALVKRHDI